jgi:hypothetical protein
MAISEIEKLERRYAENPQGLTFAPLAEVHRKNGDVGRALELLRPGLQLHPDYIPASIVLGRCHFDLGDLPAAEAAFNHVLALDGENVIALKALADISERVSRFDDAERWLRSLLSVDRSNDEARSQLERVEAARRQTELGSSVNPEAASGLELTAEPPGRSSAPPVEGERLPEGETSEPMISWVSDVSARETVDAAVPQLEELTPESVSPTLEAMEGTEELDPQHPFVEPVEPIPGLVGRDQENLELGEGFKVETSEDIILQSSGGGEFQVPDASEELIAGSPAPRAFEEDVPLSSAGYEPPSPFGFDRAGTREKAEEKPEERAKPAAEQPVSEPEPVAQAERAPEPEWQATDATVTLPELVTAEFTPPPPESPPVETGAPEATASQPSEDSAPWQFSASQPAPPPPTAESQPMAPPPYPPEPLTVPEPELVLTETMAEVLRDQGHSADALRVYRELETRSAGNPRLRQKIAELEEAARALVSAPKHTYVASETQGQSVAEFFRALLAARPPAVAPAPTAATPAPMPEAAGAPTRPATETLSLSAVFGEEGTPTPPAVPGVAPSGGSGVSYDEFFGGQAGAGSQRSVRNSDAKSDDLDQFHAWLQNLKR